MDRKKLQSYLDNENIQFFLYSILKFESGKVRGRVNTGGHNETSGNSSAFGSQQFIGDTRNGILQRYGIDAWSPDLEEQQLATLALLHRGKQLDNAAKGDYSNINDWEAFTEERRFRLNERPSNWLEEYNRLKSDSVYDPASSWDKIPEEMKKSKQRIFERKYSDIDFESITTGKPTEDPSSVISTEADEKPEISPLRQSVIDKFLKQRKSPDGERLMQAILGNEIADKIIEGGEKEIEKYVRSLDEDDLIKTSDMTAEEVADVITKKNERRNNRFQQESEFIDEIVNNPSLYSVDLVKKARIARANITDFIKTGSGGASPTTGAPGATGRIVSRDEVAKSLEGLIERKSEEEGGLRDKQTGIKFKQITDPETGQRVTVEDIDLVGELPDAALPKGVKDAKTEFTDDELTNIEEGEEEDEDVTIGLSKRKRKKALRKAGATPESKLAQFLKKTKLGLGDVSQAMNAAGFALSAGAGIMSIAEAREKDSVSKSQVDPLFTEAVNKVRAASETGMPYEQRQAAMKDINNAYVGAMKNVMAISGGQRGLALANVGVVDANRLNSLVDLASKDSDMRQKNLELFAKTSAEYSNQKLTADMNFQKLKSTLDMNRKNRLAEIGGGLLDQAQQYGANYTATRSVDKIVGGVKDDSARVQQSLEKFYNDPRLLSFQNELSEIDQDNNLDRND